MSHNAPFRTEMCTFLFWMEQCGLWNRCILGFVKLLYFHQLKDLIKMIWTNPPLLYLPTEIKSWCVKWPSSSRIACVNDMRELAVFILGFFRLSPTRQSSQWIDKSQWSVIIIRFDLKYSQAILKCLPISTMGFVLLSHGHVLLIDRREWKKWDQMQICCYYA